MRLRIKDIDFESNGRVFFFRALFADNGTRVYEGAAKLALWVQRSETANPKLSEVIFIYIGYLKILCKFLCIFCIYRVFFIFHHFKILAGFPVSIKFFTCY